MFAPRLFQRSPPTSRRSCGVGSLHSQQPGRNAACLCLNQKKKHPRRQRGSSSCSSSSSQQEGEEKRVTATRASTSDSKPSPAFPTETALEVDLVLSSGFLAFANHSGFLQAVEDNAVRVTGVMGTSAGALTGSMYSAGYSPAEILRETTRDPPWKLLRPSWKFWQGLFSLDGVVERLRELLPATFEELDRDFACAVLTSSGDYIVLDSGPLPEAVAASAAIPFLFAPVHIPGREGLGGGPFQDGGARERVGLGPWRRRLQSLDKGGEDERAAELGAPRPRLALVHLIQRSFGPLSGNDSMAREERGDYTLVTSPKSGVSLLSLGDFEAQFEAAKERTARTIRKLQQAGRTATKPKDLPAKGS